MQPRANDEGESDIEIVTEEISKVYRCQKCKRCYLWKALYQYHACIGEVDPRRNGGQAGPGLGGNGRSPPVASPASPLRPDSPQQGPSSSFRMHVDEPINDVHVNGENANGASASIPAMGAEDGVAAMALPPGPKSAKAKWAKMRLSKDKKIQDWIQDGEAAISSGTDAPSHGDSVVVVDPVVVEQGNSPPPDADLISSSSNSVGGVTREINELNGNQSRKRSRSRAENPGPKEKPFHCQYCNRTFTRERTLNSHVHAMHELRKDSFVDGDDFEEEEQGAYRLKTRSKARKRSGSGGNSQGQNSSKENVNSNRQRTTSGSASNPQAGCTITLTDEGIGKGTATVIGEDPSARGTSITCIFCRMLFPTVETLRRHAVDFHRVGNLI